MSTHKIDRIFSEKLSFNEVTPSEAAWKSISAQIEGKKKSPTFLKYAAAAIVVISAWFVFSTYKAEQSAQMASSIEITNPIDEIFSFNWTIDNDESVRQSITATIAETKVGQNAIEDNKLEPQVTLDRVTFDTYELASISSTTINVDMDLSMGSIGQIIVQEPAVRIQYIANNSQEENSKFKKFIDYARSSSPVDIFSDIRGAKDQFLSEKISLD